MGEFRCGASLSGHQWIQHEKVGRLRVDQGERLSAARRFDDPFAETLPMELQATVIGTTRMTRITPTVPLGL